MATSAEDAELAAMVAAIKLKAAGSKAPVGTGIGRNGAQGSGPSKLGALKTPPLNLRGARALLTLSTLSEACKKEAGRWAGVKVDGAAAARPMRLRTGEHPARLEVAFGDLRLSDALTKAETWPGESTDRRLNDKILDLTRFAAATQPDDEVLPAVDMESAEPEVFMECPVADLHRLDGLLTKIALHPRELPARRVHDQENWRWLWTHYPLIETHSQYRAALSLPEHQGLRESLQVAAEQALARLQQDDATAAEDDDDVSEI